MFPTRKIPTLVALVVCQSSLRRRVRSNREVLAKLECLWRFTYQQDGYFQNLLTKSRARNPKMMSILGPTGTPDTNPIFYSSLSEIMAATIDWSRHTSIADIRTCKGTLVDNNLLLPAKALRKTMSERRFLGNFRSHFRKL